MSTEKVDVLVIGGGPAGLAAAIGLRRAGVGRVVVLEREAEAGGVPRHSDHQGYGIVDLRRPLTGPQYARLYTRDALAAGAELRLETSVVGWVGDRRIRTTSPAGVGEIEASAVVLATGCRERPRSARLVPGTRPSGIFMTGSLQQFVHLHGATVGRRAVVVGAEHVSFSALLTLAHSRTKVVAMVTEQPRHQSYSPLKLVTADLRGVPVLIGQKVTGIVGRHRVEAVEITDLATGSVRALPCDTVVFTGNWIPDHELARLGGLQMDPGTKGPRIDAALRTSVEGVFAAGNLLHGAETSDVAAGEGRHVADGVRSWLATGRWPERTVPIGVVDPIIWISPNAVVVGDGRDGGSRPPGGGYVLRVNRFVSRPLLEAAQGGEVLWRGHPTSGTLASLATWLPDRALGGALVPARPVHLVQEWAMKVRPDRGEVSVRVAKEI